MTLVRYWFEFEINPRQAQFPRVSLGCGVIAYNYEDALVLITEKVFQNIALLPIKSVVEHIDVSTLDSNHNRSSKGLTLIRGAWFPLGYS